MKVRIVATMMSSARLMDSLLMYEATDTNVQTMMAGIRLVRDKSPVVDLEDDKELLPSSLILLGVEALLLPPLSKALLLLLRSCSSSSSLTLSALFRMDMLMCARSATIYKLAYSSIAQLLIATKREGSNQASKSKRITC